jgi:hypothetical protein
MNFSKLHILAILIAFTSTLGITSAVATENSIGCTETAQLFWKEFRIYVVKNQLNQIANHTQFPFELRGELDSSGSRKITRSKFIKILPTLMRTDPGLSANTSTMKSYVKSTPQLLPSHCTVSENQFKVGVWTFHLNQEGWHFAHAFLSD